MQLTTPFVQIESPVASGRNDGFQDQGDGSGDGAKVTCRQPVQVIGVQSESPLSWAADGSRVAFVSGNRSIYICTRSEDPDNPLDYAIDGEKLLPGHVSSVLCLSFSTVAPNILVSGAAEGFNVWDVDSGEIVKCVSPENDRKAHEADVLCACWTSDGNTLITGSKDCTIRVWDALANYRWLETITGHKAPILSIRINKSTTKLASAGRDSTIKLWDSRSLQLECRKKRADDSGIRCDLEANMDGHRGDVVALSFAADGHTIFSGARDNTIKVWDTRSARELRTITGHMGDVRRLLLLNNDQYLYSASMDGLINLWRLLPSDEDVPTVGFGEESEAARALALEEIIGEAAPTTVTSALATEVEKDELLASVRAFDEDVTEMEICPGYPILITSSSYNCVRVWNIRNVAKPELTHEFAGHTGAVSRVVMLPGDESILTGSQDYNINMYRVSNMRREAGFRGRASVLALAYAPQHRIILAGGTDYTIRAYPLQATARDAKKDIARFVGHSGRVKALAVSSDGRLMASGSQDFTMCVWDLQQQYQLDKSVEVTPMQTVQAHEGHVMDLAFSEAQEDGTVFLASCGNDHAVTVFRVRSRSVSEMCCFSDAHSSVVSAIAWGRNSSASTLFSGGWDHKIKVWPLGQGSDRRSSAQRPLVELKGHAGRITAIETDNSGQRLVSTSADGYAIVWSAVAPYVKLALYMGYAEDGSPVSMAAGDSLFCTGYENGMIKVWPLYGAEDYQEMFEEAGATQDGTALTSQRSISLRNPVTSKGRSDISPAVKAESLVEEEQTS